MFLAMVIAVLARAYWESEEVHITVAIKNFSRAYFYLGLSFYKEVYLDKETEVFILGLFFFSVEATFVKGISEEQQEIIDRIKKKIDELENGNASAQSDDSSVQP